MSGATGPHLRIGSRASTLARWQADRVRHRLLATHPDLRIEIILLRTTGDRITDVPLARIGDRGLFTKEIDRAVLSAEVDLAVHSLKDVPTRLESGLAMAAVLEREDPRDAFLPAPDSPRELAGLPPGVRVGTSSLRRRSQLLERRPDLVVDDFRGNLDTRLRRLEEGAHAAAILALAGIRRLGREEAVGEVLDPPDWLPAAGQGALAVVCREGDRSALELLRPLDDAESRAATTAERAFLRALEGGCQIPVGALALPEADLLRLHGFVGSLDGRTTVRGSATMALPGAAPQERRTARGPGAATPEELGRGLAERLRNEGAEAILAAVRGHGAALPDASAP